MKQLLCALIFIGAFFALTPPAIAANCPSGSTYNALSGSCEVPAGYGESFTATWSHYSASAQTRHEALTILAQQITSSSSSCINSNEPGSLVYTGFTVSFGTNSGTITASRQCVSATMTSNRPDVSFTPIPLVPYQDYYCPSDDPRFQDFYAFNPDNNTCGRSPSPIDCDCSNLQGQNSNFGGTGANYRAPVGQYTRETPPPCLNITDPITGQQCPCGVVTNNWLTTASGNEIVDGQVIPYERWETLGGTFTGATCGAEDTAPGQNETCFTLANGTQWCLGDPNMDCQVINGMQQCRQGCGYFNDDFVCYDIDDPGTPDPDDTQQNPIDDNISDPNKPIQDMIKGDFKDVQRGTEQRLDNINITLGNQNNRLDGTNNRLDQANRNLDGIGRQLDGMGRELKGIGDTIGDAFADDGEGAGDVDGTCTDEGICSWYESAYPDGLVGIWQEHSAALQQTAMFDFLNQFTLSPNGSQPDFGMCFNLGPLGDFGCHNFDIPAIIWSFIFICIQITAVFLCRRLIFGG